MAEIFSISLLSVLLATVADKCLQLATDVLVLQDPSPEESKYTLPWRRKSRAWPLQGAATRCPSLSGAVFGHSCPKPLKDGVREGGAEKHLLVHSGPGSQFPIRCLIKVSYTNQLTTCLLHAEAFFKRHLLPISCTLDLNVGPNLIQNLVLSSASCITPNSTSSALSETLLVKCSTQKSRESSSCRFQLNQNGSAICNKTFFTSSVKRHAFGENNHFFSVRLGKCIIS